MWNFKEKWNFNFQEKFQDHFSEPFSCPKFHTNKQAFSVKIKKKKRDAYTSIFTLIEAFKLSMDNAD